MFYIATPYTYLIYKMCGKSLVACVNKCGMGVEQLVLGDGDEYGMFQDCGVRL